MVFLLFYVSCLKEVRSMTGCSNLAHHRKSNSEDSQFFCLVMETDLRILDIMLKANAFLLQAEIKVVL